MKQIITACIFMGFMFVVSCEGTKTAEEYYSQAEIERNAKNVKLSLENLENLVKHYPENSLAPKALYLTGDIYMNDLRDFQNAIAFYVSVVNDYPGSAQEAQAQFMVGYVQANILNDIENAKKSYQIFLEKFPKHELVPSVKFEMENIGKNVNEISVLKHIAS